MGEITMKTLAALIFLFIIFSTQAFALDQFPTEQQAQQHCPKDTVVWLNTATGIFHYKGERWYGRTKRGAFVCQKEAAKEGDRSPTTILNLVYQQAAEWIKVGSDGIKTTYLNLSSIRRDGIKQKFGKSLTSRQSKR